MPARAGASLLALLFLAGAAAADEGVAPPRQWIGTTEQWLQALGIAFVVLDLMLLAVAWRSLRGGTESRASRTWLLVAVGLVPVSVAFLAAAHGLERSTTVASCGSCHLMTPYVADLHDVKSDTLAAVHAKNRYIRERHCYTCHSDYGLAGTLQAKMAGLGHVWRYTTGAYSLPLRIAHPYPNTRCLECHGESVKFLASSDHPKEDMPDFFSGKTSCLDCHAPAHPKAKREARR